MFAEKEYQWTVTKKEQETPDTTSLYLAHDMTRPDFIAGQYLTIKLTDMGPAEGKAYSISSAPHEELLRVTIKKLGTFSSKLLSLSPDDSITTSDPYGFFYPDPEDKMPIVFLAGGIGITPIMSIIKSLSHQKDERPLYLLSSNQTNNIVFESELEQLQEENKNLSVQHFVTQENSETHTARRFNQADLAKLGTPQDAEYFVCGSADFTKSVWRDLIDQEIPQHQIYTEGFF